MNTNSDATTLVAERQADGWSVVDPEGGRWWPNEATAEEIESAEDPAAKAVEICDREPMRGQWHS